MIFLKTCKYLDVDIKIGGFTVSQVDSAKYLGIYIDSDLTFKEHVTHVLQKLSANSGVLRRLSHYVSDYILRTIYLLLMYPYLMYGVQVWGE